MNSQPRLPGGQPATSPQGIAAQRTEFLHEVTNVFGQMTKTTSNFTHDMHALGVKPVHALLMLSAALGLMLVLTTVDAQCGLAVKQ